MLYCTLELPSQKGLLEWVILGFACLSGEGLETGLLSALVPSLIFQRPQI